LHSHQPPERNSQAKGLAFLFLALMLAALGARFWATEKAAGLTGPTHIAAEGGLVYLFASGDMFRLTADGALLSVTPSERTGLSDDPIDLRVVDNGQLLIAEQQPAAIKVCNPESWACRPHEAALGNFAKRQFKVLPDASGTGLLMTDAPGDTLWRIYNNTSEPQKLLPDHTLAGPNDLVYGDEGKLWVADTDNRRIVELVPSTDGAFLPGREHSAVNDLTVNERYFPMMLARRADGRLWVIQAADFSKAEADLVIYDQEQGAQALVALPGGAYPTDIAAIQGAALVTDLEQFRVYRVDSATADVDEFGDEAFRAHLAQIQDRQNHFKLLGVISLVVLIFSAGLMVAAAVKGTPKHKRWTEPPLTLDPANAAEQVPATTGVYWLKRDPKMEWSLKWLEHLGLILFIILVVGALALYLWIRILAGPDISEKTNELWIPLLLSGVVLAFLVPVMSLATRNLKHRIGTDGKRLYIRLAEGRELAVDPSSLFYTSQALLYRQYTLPLHGGKQKAIYAKGEVETWLAPLLRQSTRLTALEGIKYQWKNGVFRF
jgi:hypothetical protein